MIDTTRRETLLAAVAAALCGAVPAAAQAPARFVAAWTGSVHGPYPVGSPTAEPDLRWAFPDAAEGARDQTFRLTVKPDIWGRQARIRLSNAFGTKAVTFGDVHVGLR